jgi:hypothetical protein
MSESKDSVKDLKAEAKWASDFETQKESIEELSRHGKEAIPALEEVKAVTTQDDIRQEVDAAIRGAKDEAKREKAKARSRPSQKGTKKKHKKSTGKRS